MSRFTSFSFYTGFILATIQFLIIISSGSILAGLFWGIIPVWFWATYQKLKQEQGVRQLEGIASYAIVVYGGVLALLGFLCFFATIGFMVADAEVIQAAIEQQPNYDDFSEEQLDSMAKVMEVLPSIMPFITIGVFLQSIAYIGYGLAIVKNYSR